VAVNGIIQVEIVAFAPNEASYRKLVADFQAFHWLDLGPEEFALAAELGFRLRRQGITVPATDLIIAASGIHGRAL
jgi:predicted nucleic acid-binding protein